MGMFDSYFAEEFKCPSCGTLHRKEQDFQSKEFNCLCKVYVLGGYIDESRRYCDWYCYCDGRYIDKTGKRSWETGFDRDNYPLCQEGEFNCRVFLNEKGIAVNHKITMFKKDGTEQVIKGVK